MQIISCCGFEMFCTGVWCHLLYVASSWQLEQATVLWCGCFYLVKKVRTVVLLFQGSVKCSEDFFFPVISPFVSPLLPILETSREYFSLAELSSQDIQQKLCLWLHCGYVLAQLTAIAGPTGSCISTNILQRGECSYLHWVPVPAEVCIS